MISSQIQEIPADQLDIDPRVQRALDPGRVRKLANGWDDLMAGVLTVSRRQEPVVDATVYDTDVTTDLIVLDGQTRLAAFKLVCGEATTNPMVCQVYSGLTLQEEAAMFLDHNDRKAVHGRDRFRLANTAGEEWALNITAIAEHFGWVAEGSGEKSKLRRFKCISTAERIYKADDGVALRRAFEVISNVWNGQADAVCTETLSGIGQLFIKHPELEPKQVHGLVTKLRRLTVGSYIGEVTADKRRNGISIAQAAYLFTAGVYNRGRSEDNRI